MLRKWKELSAINKIGVAFVLGIIAGFIFGPSIAVIEPMGTLFIRLLQMLVFPLVFFSIVSGVASITDTKKMARVGAKAIFLYMITTAFAIAIGLLFANAFKPGVGIDLGIGEVGVSTVEAPSIVNTLLNMVPTNPMAAFADGHILGVIVFAVFFGMCIVTMKNRDYANKIASAFEMLTEVMTRMTEMVISYAPYGVFALIATVVGTQGTDVLISLGKLIIVYYVAVFAHMFVVQGLILVKGMAGLNPIKFFKNFMPALTFGFVTDSSNATLPISMRCAQENMGISKSISSFVQPLGATINMDGGALYQGMVSVFVAQILGVDLTLGQQLTILFTALLASIGTAGVPGASLIMLSMTLTSVGLPVEGIAIVAGVDRILAFVRILPNIAGDAAVALVIAKQENELDVDVFNNSEESRSIKSDEQE